MQKDRWLMSNPIHFQLCWKMFAPLPKLLLKVIVLGITSLGSDYIKYHSCQLLNSHMISIRDPYTDHHKKSNDTVQVIMKSLKLHAHYNEVWPYTSLLYKIMKSITSVDLNIYEIAGWCFSYYFHSITWIIWWHWSHRSHTSPMYANTMIYL